MQGSVWKKFQTETWVVSENILNIKQTCTGAEPCILARRVRQEKAWGTRVVAKLGHRFLKDTLQWLFKMHNMGSAIHKQVSSCKAMLLPALVAPVLAKLHTESQSSRIECVP